MHTDPLQLVVEIVQTPSQIQERERSARLRGVLTQLSLRDENVLFERTGTPVGQETDQPRVH
jgi:hypothetical protein